MQRTEKAQIQTRRTSSPDHYNRAGGPHSDAGDYHAGILALRWKTSNLGHLSGVGPRDHLRDLFAVKVTNLVTEGIPVLATHVAGVTDWQVGALTSSG